MSPKHVELLTAPVGALYLFYDVRPLFSGEGVPFTVQELANDLKDRARKFRLDVWPPLPYMHRARRVAPQLHTLFGCYLPPAKRCSAV